MYFQSGWCFFGCYWSTLFLCGKNKTLYWIHFKHSLSNDRLVVTAWELEVGFTEQLSEITRVNERKRWLKMLKEDISAHDLRREKGCVVLSKTLIIYLIFNLLRPRNINWQDWKYISFAIFICHSQNIRHHNAIGGDYNLLRTSTKTLNWKLSFNPLVFIKWIEKNFAG